MKNNQTVKIALIVSLIIGSSILGFGYMNYKYKMAALEREEKTRVEEIKREEERERDRERSLSSCYEAANKAFSTTLDEECGRMGKTRGCSLPKWKADAHKAVWENQIDNCIKLYGK